MAGRRRDPVLRPFAVADDDEVGPEIDVLHSQARALEEAQAGPVEEQHEEAWHGVEVLENVPHLVACHDDGHVLGPPGAHQIVEPGQVLLPGSRLGSSRFEPVDPGVDPADLRQDLRAKRLQLTAELVERSRDEVLDRCLDRIESFHAPHSSSPAQRVNASKQIHLLCYSPNVDVTAW